MFTDAYKLACATGFKGTEAEFITALRHSPQKEHTMDYGQTKLSSVSSQEHSVNKVNQAPDAFLRLLTSLLGPEMVSALQPVDMAPRPTMQPVEDMGMYQLHPELFLSEKNYEIPEKIVVSSKPETIQNFITLKMIPEFLQKLADVIKTHKGFDLLREQRKLIARLNKLMTYQARPMSIIPTAIHDEYELSIYKNYIAQQVCSTKLTVDKGVDLVNAAADGMVARLEACRLNEEKQLAEKKERDLRLVVKDELHDLVSSINSVPADELALRLRGIAEQFSPMVTTINTQTFKDAVGVRAQQPLETKHAERALEEIIPTESRRVMTGLEGNAPGSLGHLFAGISTAEMEQMFNHGQIQLGGLRSMSPEDIARLGGGVSLGNHGTYGFVQHPMDGPMGCGMMSHHFANQD